MGHPERSLARFLCQTQPKDLRLLLPLLLLFGLPFPKGTCCCSQQHPGNSTHIPGNISLQMLDRIPLLLDHPVH